MFISVKPLCIYTLTQNNYVYAYKKTFQLWLISIWFHYDWAHWLVRTGWLKTIVLSPKVAQGSRAMWISARLDWHDQRDTIFAQKNNLKYSEKVMYVICFGILLLRVNLRKYWLSSFKLWLVKWLKTTFKIQFSFK